MTDKPYAGALATQLMSSNTNHVDVPVDEFELTKKKPRESKPPLPRRGGTVGLNGAFASAEAKPFFSASPVYDAAPRSTDPARTPQAEAVAIPPGVVVGHALPPPAEAIDDFAAMLTRRYAPIPDGRYMVELLPHDIAPFRSEWKSGVSFVVGIVEGDFAGKEIALALVTEGAGTAQARVAHDLAILCKWKDALGISRAKDAEQLVRMLGKTARDGRWRVWLTISFEIRGASREPRIMSVDVEHDDD